MIVTWWAGLSLMMKILWTVTLVASVLFVIQSILTFIGADADADFAKFEGRYFATPKKMGAQTAEANINAGIAAARQINAFFRDGDTKFQVNK